MEARLAQLPGKDDSEKVRSLIMQSDLTGYIAQTVGAEVERRLLPLLTAQKSLNSDLERALLRIDALEKTTEEYTRQAAQASRAGQQIADALQEHNDASLKRLAEQLNPVLKQILQRLGTVESHISTHGGRS